MTPENVWPIALLSPTVNVTAPATPLLIVPLPLRPLTVSVCPLRFRLPLTVTFPVPVPFGITPDAPSRRLWVTVVLPV